jgi:hypothetical protein
MRRIDARLIEELIEGIVTDSHRIEAVEQPAGRIVRRSESVRRFTAMLADVVARSRRDRRQDVPVR